MQARFARFPAALERTLEIASRCQLELPLGVPHFPEIPLPPVRLPSSYCARRLKPAPSSSTTH